MVILGFALRISGFALKITAMAVAPVIAVLVVGAAEDEMDKRKNKTAEAGTGPDPGR